MHDLKLSVCIVTQCGSVAEWLGERDRGDSDRDTDRETDRQRERMGDRNGIWTVKMSQPQSTKILLIGRLVRLGPTRSYLQKKVIIRLNKSWM